MEAFCRRAAAVVYCPFAMAVLAELSSEIALAFGDRRKIIKVETTISKEAAEPAIRTTFFDIGFGLGITAGLAMSADTTLVGVYGAGDSVAVLTWGGKRSALLFAILTL